MALGSATGALAEFTSSTVALRRRTLKLPRWSASGFRIAVIGDMHMNRQFEAERARDAFRMAMAEKPDAIALVGDFINGSYAPVLKRMAANMEDLWGAPCPVLGVMGNHDYHLESPEDVLATLRSTNIRLLRNETVEVRGVRIHGLDDGLAALQRYDDVPKQDKNLIALLHEPDFVTEMPTNPSLMLSGHTHGGQICLPGGFPLMAPRKGRDYVRGFYPEARVPLFVTVGVGTSGPTWRLFSPPEVVVLTLESA